MAGGNRLRSWPMKASLADLSFAPLSNIITSVFGTQGRPQLERTPLNGFAPRYLCHFDRNNPAYPALLLPWHHCLFPGSRFGNLATFAGNPDFVGDDLRRQGYLHAVGDPSGYQNEPANRNLATHA